MNDHKLEGTAPHATALELATLLDYVDGSIVSRTLTDKKTGTITLFAFAEGQGLSEHSAPFDAFVQVVEGDDEALEDVRPCLGLGEVVDRPPDHDLLAELDEVAERLLDRECLRSPPHEREKVHAEGRLERCHLVELVQQHVLGHAALQLDHDPGQAVDEAAQHWAKLFRQFLDQNLGQ